MKIIITEDKLGNVIFNWLNRKYGDTESYQSDTYEKDIFYIKDGEVVFQYSKFSGTVYFKADLWGYIENMIGLGYFDTQHYLKQWFENKFDIIIKYTHTIEGDYHPKWKKIENEISN